MLCTESHIKVSNKRPAGMLVPDLGFVSQGLGLELELSSDGLG